MILASVFLFLTLTAVITLFGWARFVKPGRFYDSLSREAPADRPKGSRLAGVLVFAENAQSRLRLSDKNVGLIRRLLLQAGYREDRAVAVFIGLKLCCAALLGVVVGVAQSVLRADPRLGLIFTLVGAAAGYVLPGVILRRRAKARQERLRLSLPDALDLMVVSVESGIGIDQALRHVSRELSLSHPDLSQELSLVCLEMLAGERRSEALKNMAARNDDDGLRKLVAVLVQTDRFGTSVADALRTHADFMRVRRRQIAEERAGKISVKLVFPIFAFLLPAIFIVCAGPAMLAIFRQLLPSLKSMH
jgi:tight adherence protein C